MQKIRHWMTPILFFDIETTGFSSIRDRIIEIGAVKVDDNYDIIDEFNILIKPNIYPTIHPFVEKITGFTDKDFKI